MMVLGWFLIMLVFIGAVLGGVAWLLKRSDDYVAYDPDTPVRYVVMYDTIGNNEPEFKYYGEYDTIEEVRKHIATLESEGFQVIVWDNQLEDWHHET